MTGPRGCAILCLMSPLLPVPDRVGRLVPLRTVRHGAKQTLHWVCQCDCGNQAIVRGELLRKGHTKSCGCARRGPVPGRVGRLVPVRVVRRAGRTVWLCRCDCGNTTYVRAQYLRASRTKSCGCLPRGRKGERTSKARPVPKRCGSLTVLRMVPARLNGAVVWECQCDCGKVTKVRGIYLRQGTVRGCGCRRRKTKKERLQEDRVRQAEDPNLDLTQMVPPAEET